MTFVSIALIAASVSAWFLFAVRSRAYRRQMVFIHVVSPRASGSQPSNSMAARNNSSSSGSIWMAGIRAFCLFGYVKSTVGGNPCRSLTEKITEPLLTILNNFGKVLLSWKVRSRIGLPCGRQNRFKRAQRTGRLPGGSELAFFVPAPQLSKREQPRSQRVRGQHLNSMSDKETRE